VGFGAGITVTCDCTVLLFQLAVIVTGVLVVTSLVGMANDAEGLPAATVTVAGGLTAGELLDRPHYGAGRRCLTIEHHDGALGHAAAGRRGR